MANKTVKSETTEPTVEELLETSDIDVETTETSEVVNEPEAPVGALTINPDVENVVKTEINDSWVENSPADYDNLNHVPTAFSNPPAVSVEAPSDVVVKDDAVSEDK